MRLFQGSDARARGATTSGSGRWSVILALLVGLATVGLPPATAASQEAPVTTAAPSTTTTTTAVAPPPATQDPATVESTTTVGPATTVGPTTTTAAPPPAAAESAGVEPPAAAGTPGAPPEAGPPGRPSLPLQAAEIAEVATANGKSEAEVARILADPTARVDRGRRLYFVDPAPPASAAAAPPVAAAPFPYTQTFLLHSRPGAQRVIYLDFNGETISGTAWNGNNGAPTGPFFAEPFSIDASAAFSNAEQDIVQSVWQRVSEDFAPFNVDVTTADPGIAAITRSGTADQVYGTRALVTDATEINCGCGGIAYLGVFDEPNSHATYQPAFVFAPALLDDAKNIAEAVSHEVGHNFDLSHDGTASVGYYGGHGSWAPIMGTSYSRPISQWSRGEYSGANNLQADLDVIPLNGGPLLPDDHGNTSATATSLGSGPAIGGSGIITTDADVDVFRVDAGVGAATFSALPAPVSPDLDIRLELRNSAGTVLTSNDPVSGTVNSDVASGLSASISTTFSAAGSYYLFVSGVGAGAPATTGYSGYASLGRYSLSGTVSGGTRTLAVNDAPAVNEGPAGVNATATFTLTLTTAAPSTVTVVASTANGTATSGSDYTAKSATVTFAAGTTSRPFTVSIIGDGVPEGNETFFVNLTSPVGVVVGDAQGLGRILNDDAAPPANNNFSAATALSGANGSITGTNVAATKEAGEPNHAGLAGGKSIWYSWTAPATALVSFDTVGSSFDTLLAAYTGTAVNALTTKTYNNDSNGGLQSKLTFTATSGVVYRIAVDGSGAASGTVTLNWLQAPANDTFVRGIALAGAAGTINGTNLGATKEVGEPNHAGFAGGKSVWYRWTAPASGVVTIDTFASSYDTLLAIYTGTAVNALTVVTSNDDTDGPQSRVTFTATAGVVYRIAVDGYGASSGAIRLTWALPMAPANNNFAAASPITGSTGTINGTNVLATKETGEPNHAGFAGGPSVWYRWTAPAAGPVVIDTFGSSFDTLLGVYTGSAVNALTPVGSNDDTGGRQSRVAFTATSGAVYRIAVDGYGANTGSIKLNWVRDLTAPSVAWELPVGNGQTLWISSGTVTLGVVATDNVAVDRVEYMRWDHPTQTWISLPTVWSAPWQTTIDVATLNLQYNQVNAVAYDVAGNGSASPHIWIHKDPPP